MTKREGDFLKEVILEQPELPKAVEAGMVAMVKGCTKDWGLKPSSFALEKSPVLWGEPRFCDQLSEHHFLPFVFTGSISQPFAEELHRTPILAVASDLGPRFPLNGMWCTARG